MRKRGGVGRGREPGGGEAQAEEGPASGRRGG